MKANKTFFVPISLHSIGWSIGLSKLRRSLKFRVQKTFQPPQRVGISVLLDDPPLFKSIMTMYQLENARIHFKGFVLQFKRSPIEFFVSRSVSLPTICEVCAHPLYIGAQSTWRKYKKRGVEYTLYRLTLHCKFVHVVSQYKSDDSGGQSQKLYLSFANKKPTWELEIKSADGSINPQTVIHNALCCYPPIVGISNIMLISKKMFLYSLSLEFDMYVGTS